MAPEAQLLLSLTHREQLTKQTQQLKTMLALIEQLIEMDRLLGDVDESIGHHRFLVAAAGIVDVKTLDVFTEFLVSDYQEGNYLNGGAVTTTTTTVSALNASNSTALNAVTSSDATGLANSATGESLGNVPTTTTATT